MRERGLRSVLVHMSRPMTKQMWHPVIANEEIGYEIDQDRDGR